MDRNLRIISSLLLFILLTSCDLDSYLFNTQTLDEYKLPGNTIAEKYITPVTFSSEGNKLYGFWVINESNNTGITVLYCHGNKSNIDEYWDRVMLLHQLGVNVFIFDYRGYGKSEGKSSENGLYSDARAALEYVKTRKGYSTDSLCIYGYSLGNVSSIYLASEMVNPLCLIAECPFASATSLIQGSLVLDLPAHWLTDAEFNNTKEIKGIKTPLLLMHGAADSFVRFRDNGALVYNAAPNPKELLVIDGAEHTDIPYVMGTDKYLNKLREWIKFSQNYRK